jgi:hypothetical protein
MEKHREKKIHIDRAYTLRQNGFVKNLIEGKLEGKVPRGRPRDKYISEGCLRVENAGNANKGKKETIVSGCNVDGKIVW